MISRNSLELMVTATGESLAALSDVTPVLIVFLRHFGCVFCRESLHDISKKRRTIESKGIKIVLVHMSDNETAEIYFKKFNLKNIAHISDPECKIYASFGLLKGSFSQLFGLKTWIRGFEVAATKQILPTIYKIGDGLQMPGIFLLKNATIVGSFIHKTASDKPNYENLIAVCAVDQ